MFTASLVCTAMPFVTACDFWKLEIVSISSSIFLEVICGYLDKQGGSIQLYLKCS